MWSQYVIKYPMNKKIKKMCRSNIYYHFGCQNGYRYIRTYRNKSYLSILCFVLQNNFYFGFTYNVPCHINVTSLQNIVWETVIIATKVFVSQHYYLSYILWSKIVFRHILDIFEGSMSLYTSLRSAFSDLQKHYWSSICNWDFFRIYTKLVLLGGVM